MILQYTDFNITDQQIESRFKQPWSMVKDTIESMPLHLKASDQDGIQGTPIFDVVGTNEYLQSKLYPSGWKAISIPAEYDFLGKGIDFGSHGVIIEAQFSNYPFLLNNVLRSELFYKNKAKLTGKPTELVIIITKAGMFPASNSTLYYEQGVKQLTALAKFQVFSVPIRLVGLFSEHNKTLNVHWTKYSATRYSRTVVSRSVRQCTITPGRQANSRVTITLK